MTAKSFLLDSHILIWWLTGDPQLAQKIKTLISSPLHSCYVSHATIWELTIKQNIGKIKLPIDFIQTISDEGFEFLPITLESIIAIKDLPLHHKDPFDRLLAAQCITENLTLITLDQNLLKYPIRHL